MASPSWVCAFSRTNSSSRAACHVAMSATVRPVLGVVVTGLLQWLPLSSHLCRSCRRFLDTPPSTGSISLVTEVIVLYTHEDSTTPRPENPRWSGVQRRVDGLDDR